MSLTYQVSLASDGSGSGGKSSSKRNASISDLAGEAARSALCSDDRIEINTISWADLLTNSKKAVDKLKNGLSSMALFDVCANKNTEGFDRYVGRFWTPIHPPYPMEFYDSNGEPIQSMVSRENERRKNNALKVIRGYKDKYSAEIADLVKAAESFNDNYMETLVKIYNGVDLISRCMTDFDDLAHEVNFGDKLKLVVDYYIEKGTLKDTPDLEREISENGEIHYRNELTNKTYTTKELQKAAFEYGTTVVSIYTAASVADAKDMPPELVDAIVGNMLDDAKATMVTQLDEGHFILPEGMTWEEYDKLLYYEVTGKEWDPEANIDELRAYYAAIGLDYDEVAAGVFSLTGGTGSNGIGMSALVGMMMMGADSMYDYTHSGEMPEELYQQWVETLARSPISAEQREEAERFIENTRRDVYDHYIESHPEFGEEQNKVLTTSNSTRDMFDVANGSGFGSQGKPSPLGQGGNEDKAEEMFNIENPFESLDGENPSPFAKSPGSIDSEAKEIYFNKTPEEIAAERANALSAVDQAFAGENVEEFRSILKEGGFDDIDVDFIMENKELAVTAYILASESKSLTDIANSLAMANGIQNFDTMYDNGYSRLSLESGYAQAKLMGEVDNEVIEARTDVQNARNKYNSSVKKANESIEEANKRKEEMEELKKKIVSKSGSDPSKWDDEDVEAYNKAIEKYNEANRAANEAHREALSDRKLLDDAEANLSETEKAAESKYLEQAETVGDTEELSSVGGHDGEVAKVDNSTAKATDTTNTGEATEPTAEPKKAEVAVEKTETAEVKETPSKPEAGATVQKTAAAPKYKEGPGVKTTTPKIESDRKLTSDDILSLFDDIGEVSDIDANRTLDLVDLNSATEDRTLSALGVTGVSTAQPQKEVASIQPSITTDQNVTNGMVELSKAATVQAKKDSKEFQDVNLSGLGSWNPGVSAGSGTTTSYASSKESTTNSDKTDNKPDGIKIEAPVEDRRHTDGVLTGSDDEVATEISEDGRSLEFVEIDSKE